MKQLSLKERAQLYDFPYQKTREKIDENPDRGKCSNCGIFQCLPAVGETDIIGACLYEEGSRFMGKLLIIGSTCVDVVLRMDHLPVTGEDLQPESQQFSVGGCGWNMFRAARITGAMS